MGTGITFSDAAVSELSAEASIVRTTELAPKVELIDRPIIAWRISHDARND
ncbi:MAG: hypothetical protein VX911_01055 [Candidatus Latescibacterota bacterium]|nr:hypothetical protein [Candidatus Latescibacterota bacterium]